MDEFRPADERGIGAIRRYPWTTQLPYRLVFESTLTRVEPPYVLDATADGELIGRGRWSRTPTEAGTLVRYAWNEGFGLAWMNTLAPIARPVFA